jgi:hypothetical protein
MNLKSKIILPPNNLKRFNIQNNEGSYKWINYLKHPGYNKLITKASIKNTVLSVLIFLYYFLIILTKRLISYETIPTHLRKIDGIISVLIFLKEAIFRFFYNVFRLFHGKPDAVIENPISKMLSEYGVCVLKVDSSSFGKIQKLSAGLFADLRRTRGVSSGGRRFEESRSSASKTSHIKLFTEIEAYIQNSGILDGISGYIGHKIALVDVNPQINDKTDDFWRASFPDLSLRPPPTAYFHKDTSGGDIKLIFYMTNVGEKNGPFTYVIGSNPKKYCKLLNWIEETNDQSGFSNTNLRSRMFFSALPKFLRKKSSFGDDLSYDKKTTLRLLNAAWKIKGTQGHVVIFDTKGIHRGGLLENGERSVITCTTG